MRRPILDKGISLEIEENNGAKDLNLCHTLNEKIRNSKEKDFTTKIHIGIMESVLKSLHIIFKDFSKFYSFFREGKLFLIITRTLYS